MENKKLIICEKKKGYEYEGPRYTHLGQNSGEEFRKDYLVPWLNQLALDTNEEFVIDFIGTKMYSPSFLEEGFGGAIRDAKNESEAKINSKTLERIKFINIEPIRESKLKDYIKNAKYNPKNNVDN